VTARDCTLVAKLGFESRSVFCPTHNVKGTFLELALLSIWCLRFGEILFSLSVG
jgi:hypothetical protein